MLVRGGMLALYFPAKIIVWGNCRLLVCDKCNIVKKYFLKV